VASDGTALFQTSQFARILSAEFLCLADLKPAPISLAIHVNDHDLQRFRTFTKGEEELKQAMKLFRKRDRSMAAED
jgi:hypothetical protein